MKKNKGFTLIELLVVIAIIGILASVVLASLNSARNKGADAAVKSNLANSRAQAELFYDSNGNSYYKNSSTGNVCATTALVNGIGGINKHVLAAAKAAGVTTVSVNSTATTTNSVCNVETTGNNGQKWAATAPLKNPATTDWVACVDSTGFAGEANPSTVTAANPACQ